MASQQVSKGGPYGLPFFCLEKTDETSYPTARCITPTPTSHYTTQTKRATPDTLMTLVINLNPVETSYSTARCISVYATKLMTLVIKVLPETSSRTARCIAVNAASLMTLVIKTNMFSVIKVTVVTKGTDVPVKSGHL